MTAICRQSRLEFRSRGAPRQDKRKVYESAILSKAPQRKKRRSSTTTATIASKRRLAPTPSRRKPVGSVAVETRREDGTHQSFAFAQHGEYWESLDDIREPHGFDVNVTVQHRDHEHTYQTAFAEHEHHHADHVHHDHLDHHHGHAHAHTAQRQRKRSSRTALLLILGSSPMIEGIPAFFAAAKYGLRLIVIMALVFAASTIMTYGSFASTRPPRCSPSNLGPVKRYAEVLSGVFSALVGLAFWLFPVL